MAAVKKSKKAKTPKTAGKFRGKKTSFARKAPFPKKAALSKKTSFSKNRAAVKKGAHAGMQKKTAERHRMTAALKMWKTQLLADPQVRQMLINVAGEHTLHVIGEFDRQMSDEEIAKKTALRTSDVRVVLNKLHSHGLVSYSRSRDRNSGWYSYVWKMNNDKAREIIGQMKNNGENPGAAPAGGGEAAECYYCRSCDPKKAITFERASDYMFKCAQCGSNLEYLGGQE